MKYFSQDRFLINTTSSTNPFNLKKYVSYVVEYAVVFGISYQLEQSFFGERKRGEYYPEDGFVRYLFIFKPSKCLLSALGVWGVGKLLAEKDSFGKAFVGAVFGEIVGFAVAVLSPDLGEYAFFHMPPLFTVIAYNF